MLLLDGVRLKNWISDKYGELFKIRLFRNDNTEIFPTELGVTGWRFDYPTGVLTFNGIPLGLLAHLKLQAIVI